MNTDKTDWNLIIEKWNEVNEKCLQGLVPGLVCGDEISRFYNAVRNNNPEEAQKQIEIILEQFPI